MGYGQKEWDEWFDKLLSSMPSEKESEQMDIEKVFEKIHYDKNFEEWVRNFALNLQNVWNGFSARVLDPGINKETKSNSSIIIGAGPSVKKNDHLKKIADSNYKGNIICTDRMLIPALRVGITPDRFPKYYVATIDGAEVLKRFYNDEIVKTYGPKITGIFSTVVHPLTVQLAREAGIKMHWIHSLFDYNEGRKSFNQMTAVMVRANKHTSGLPALQTGGNVGTSCWFIAWKILKSPSIALIGIDHSWDVNDRWEEIAFHTNAPVDIDKNSPLFQKLFPKTYNPEFNTYCMLDPVFLYYSSALKEFIRRAPQWVNTFNATEGGCIFGERITCTTLEKFLNEHKD